MAPNQGQGRGVSPQQLCKKANKNKSKVFTNIPSILWVICFTTFNIWCLKYNPNIKDFYSTLLRSDTIELEWMQWEENMSNGGRSKKDSRSRKLEYVMNNVGAKYEGQDKLNVSLPDWRGEEKGKIAWLMSFPNSGTSYTMQLIQQASNTTAASNYGLECATGIDGKSSPVHDWTAKGPYWLPLYNQVAKHPPKAASILTKTHCGSHCVDCTPNGYLETTQSYLIKCLSGQRLVPLKEDEDADELGHKFFRSAKPGYKMKHVTYSPSLVEKAVHLMRNPFDNLVSRFHHEQKKQKTHKSSEWAKEFTNDPQGFNKWCAHQDVMFRPEEEIADWESFGYDSKKIKFHFQNVKCHAEFFRYIQWHNEAVKAVQELGIPVIKVHYEHYITDLEGQMNRILGFLRLTRSGVIPAFDSDKDYSEYFSLEERAAASNMMRDFATDAVKSMMERYWVLG